MKRSAFGLPGRLSDCKHWSIVPFLLRHPDYGGQAGTDTSLKTLTQSAAADMGHFHQVGRYAYALHHTANLPSAVFLPARF
jgi:hypothetical protein